MASYPQGRPSVDSGFRVNGVGSHPTRHRGRFFRGHRHAGNPRRDRGSGGRPSRLSFGASPFGQSPGSWAWNTVSKYAEAKRPMIGPA